MPLWFKLALKEFFSHKSFSLSFIFNLCLGLVGFLTLDAFKSSLDESLSSRSRSILAADIGFRSKRPITDQERELILKSLPEEHTFREEIGLFTMASSEKRSRLTEIRAIDQHFPFYGQLGLKKAGKVGHEKSQDLIDHPHVWVYPELALQLEADIGDTILIGEKPFVITDFVESDPSISNIALSASPRAYMGLNHLRSTDLIQHGSRVQYSHLYKLNDSVDLSALSKTISDKLDLADLDIRTHQTASRELGVLLSYLNDYLSLVAMVALFLAAVGTAYLFRSYLLKRQKEIAILLSLGYSHQKVQAVYLSLLLLLGGAATVISILVAAMLLPFLPQLLGEIMVEDIVLSLPFKSMLLALFMGLGASVLFCLPFLATLPQVRPSALFREGEHSKLKFKWRSALGWLPALFIYWLLAVAQAKSWTIGSLFVLLFFVACLALGLIGWASLKLFKGISQNRSIFILRMASLYLSRQSLSTITCFISIGLGVMLFNLIPQMRIVIEDQIKTPDPKFAPSLFVFDIQDEQLQDFKATVTSMGHQVQHVSPLIRARLVDFSGQKVELGKVQKTNSDTREEAMKKRLQKRAYNLSYRAELSDSEKLVGGVPFSGAYDWNSDALPEVSLEIRFAKRLGIELGDSITFDVQGVEIEAKVVSFRKVKWASFQPNFFVQFQPGILDDAPKTHIASIIGLNLDQKIALQNDLVKKLPNVSIIDITQTIKRMLDLIGQMTQAINFMAALTALASLGVLFSIARHQAQTRQRDFNLFKVLGTPLNSISKMVSLEFGLITLSASLFGLGLSIAFSYALSYFVFDRAWLFRWAEPLLILSATLILACATAYLATRKSMQSKAIELLK